MRGAIRGPQTPSDAIRGTQREARTRHRVQQVLDSLIVDLNVPDEGRHQMQSDAIRCNQQVLDSLIVDLNVPARRAEPRPRDQWQSERQPWQSERIG